MRVRYQLWQPAQCLSVLPCDSQVRQADGDAQARVKAAEAGAAAVRLTADAALYQQLKEAEGVETTSTSNVPCDPRTQHPASGRTLKLQALHDRPQMLPGWTGSLIADRGTPPPTPSNALQPTLYTVLLSVGTRSRQSPQQLQTTLLHRQAQAGRGAGCRCGRHSLSGWRQHCALLSASHVGGCFPLLSAGSNG